MPKTQKRKKYDPIKSQLVLRTKKLNPREKRYCSCLMKVRGKGIDNPYGICTSAVFINQGFTKNKMIPCTIHYDLKKYPLKILRPYAKEKKIKNFNTLKRSQLLKELKELQQLKKNKYLKKKE